MIEGKKFFNIYKVLRNYEGRFLDVEIPPKALELIKKSAMYAPFAPNPVQGWRYAILSGAKLDELGLQAPLGMLCFHAYSEDEPNRLAQKGALFAGIYNMRLQAIVMGIASRLILDVDPYVEKAYELTGFSKDEWEFSAIVLLGYPMDRIEPSKAERDVIWRIE